MKTTLEIPHAIFRRMTSKAAEQGIPLREFVTEAVKDKLKIAHSGAEKPWMCQKFRDLGEKSPLSCSFPVRFLSFRQNSRVLGRK